MHSTIQDSPSQSLKFAREILPIFGFFAALSYIVGFFIVNLHLAGFNFATFELVKGRYLSAGLCFFYLFGISLIPQIMLKIIYRSLSPELKITLSFRYLLLPGLVIISLLITGGVLLISGFIKFSWSYTVSLFTFLAFVNLLAHVLEYALTNRYLNGQKPNKDSFFLMFKPFIVTKTTLYLVFLIAFFAIYIFPRIPAAVGGGRPVVAQVIIRSEIFSALFQKDPDQSQGGLVTLRDVKLLFDDDNSYLIQLESDSNSWIVQVPKTEIKLLVFRNSKVSEERAKTNPTPTKTAPK